MTAAIQPPPPGTTFTRDPVTVTTAVFAFAQAIVAVLLLTEVFSAQVGGVVAGVITAAWAAVQLLMVRPATVPRQPLAELAYEEANQTPPSTSAVKTTIPPQDPDDPTTHIIGGPI